MSIIGTLENKLLLEYKKKWLQNASIERSLVESSYDWLKLEYEDGFLKGNGNLSTPSNSYLVEVLYSPFFKGRFDRIYIRNANIKYNSKIHLYADLSLCLYHPRFDKPLGKIIPLVKMIPWISEWCIHYEEWKKYGIWFGKEISHEV